MTLKVGDKVKTAWGDVGTVACFRVPGKYADVLIPGRRGPSSVTPGAGTYWINSLEKIEDSPRFKVGDRVRSLNHKDSTVIVTVTNPSHKGAFVRARFDHGGHGLWVESELEKVGVPFKLERGDKVVNRLTGREGIVQQWIDGLFVTDAKPPRRDHVPTRALEKYEDLHPGTYDLIKKDAPW